MTPDVPSLSDRLRAAQLAVVAADCELGAARRKVADLEAEQAATRAREKLAAALAQGEISAHLLGEIVADAARDHGAVSAREGSISEATWRGFRTALAALVHRLEEAEQSLRERTAEREALCERVSALEETRRS